MRTTNFTELSDQELLQKIKTLKNNKIFDAGIIGVAIGIVIYSAVNHGFGLFTLVPLLLAYVIIRNSANNKLLENQLQQELDSRNMNSENAST